jgi:thiamine-phosphate pyrophosphorylase
MKLIVITSDKEIKNEAFVINILFDKGLDILHLRKPFVSKGLIEGLFYEIDAEYHNRIVLHEHFELASLFTVKGIHLNSRNPDIPQDFSLSVTKSCHSFDSLSSIDRFDYVFLSPIYNSISKNGYSSNFSHEQLIDARHNNIINNKIIALGGINISNIEAVAKYGFGGAAILGTLWNDYEIDADKDILIEKFIKIREKCSLL